MKKIKESFPKVTMDDMRAIKTGTSVTYTAERPKDLNSIRTRAYLLNVSEPELGKRFSCAIDFAKRQITITANPI